VAESLDSEIEAAIQHIISIQLENGDVMACLHWARATYRTNQRSPSVALCWPDFNSLRTRSWRVSDSAGAASLRFCTFYDRHQSVLWQNEGQGGTNLDVGVQISNDTVESSGTKDV
jgi:hypothetical protein